MTHPPEAGYDVLIVGGGIAGLSAALVLGRCRRRVLVCDHGKPRNIVSSAVHAFLSRDGVHPLELRRMGREQLEAYPCVSWRDAEVTGACTLPSGLQEIVLQSGERFTGRRILIATGLRDELPPLENIRQFYGTSVHHCPICDGWEAQDEPLVAYGAGKAAFLLALDLLGWSRQVALCSNGPCELTAAQRERLERHGVRVVEQSIARLEGVGGKLERVALTNGDSIPAGALFFTASQDQACSLAEKLGCEVTPELREVVVDEEARSRSRPHIYVVGNASEGPQLAIAAAAEGARAAHDIHGSLLDEDFP